MARTGSSADKDPTLPPLLGAELVEQLEREITQLSLPPGAKLVVDTIAERFGLSRSPVREALQTLAGMGLVEHVPRRGMFVTPLSVARLDEIYACRRPLEALAAAGTAERVTPALRKALARVLARMDGARDKGRRAAAFEANVAFTDLLHAHCGNDLLQRLLETLDKQALRYRYCCYQEREEMVSADIAANHALAGAINAGDPAEAARLTERLIDASWEMVRTALLARPDLAPELQGRGAAAAPTRPHPPHSPHTTDPGSTGRKNA